MARRLFFVEEVHHGRAEVRGEDAKHLTKALRVEPGQRYEISDNRSLYLAEVAEAHRERVVFRVLEKTEPRPAAARIALLAALIKFDRLEWIVEKATELGAEELVLVEAARSEKGLDKAAAGRLARWRKIAFESAQQSRRARLPEIAGPERFQAALGREGDCRIFLDEEEAPALLDVLPETRSREDRVLLLAGPEGGWTAAEREWAEAAGWRRASLGPQILRAETAAVAALAVVANAWYALRRRSAEQT